MKLLTNIAIHLILAMVFAQIGYLLGSQAESNIEPPLESIEITVSDEEIEPIPPKEEVYYDVPLDTELQDYIREICESNDVPMTLVLALISVESSFRPNIISATNDYGLMQINAVNHEWLTEKYGITDFLDPYQNVYCGVVILSQHLAKCEDEHMALMAYHFGATGAKRLWDKGVYATEYTNRIIEIKEKYDNEIK